MKTVVYLLACVVVALSLSMGYQLRETHAQQAELRAFATEHRQSFCILKKNARSQLESSREYLEDVRSGKREPIPGITTGDIREGMQRQQRTLHALRHIHC